MLILSKSKKIFALFICIVSLAFISGCTSSAQQSQAATTPAPAINPIDADAFECHVKYVGFKIINRQAKPEILVYYRFTNNDDNDKKFSSIVRQKAYQDGAMLDYAFGHSTEEDDCNTRIQPGASIIVASGFYLRNQTSPVDVTVSEDIPFIGDELGTMTIPIL